MKVKATIELPDDYKKEKVEEEVDTTNDFDWEGSQDTGKPIITTETVKSIDGQYLAVRTTSTVVIVFSHSPTQYCGCSPSCSVSFLYSSNAFSSACSSFSASISVW